MKQMTRKAIGFSSRTRQYKNFVIRDIFFLFVRGAVKTDKRLLDD